MTTDSRTCMPGRILTRLAAAGGAAALSGRARLAVAPGGAARARVVLACRRRIGGPCRLQHRGDIVQVRRERFRPGAGRYSAVRGGRSYGLSSARSWAAPGGADAVVEVAG